MNKILYYICLTLTLFTAVSCIKEDLSDCPNGTVFRFKMENKYPDNFIAQSDLHNAALFIFDENDNFVQLWDIPEPALDSVYAPNLKLPAGTYSLVVWINIEEPYETVPELGNFADELPLRSQKEFRLTVPSSGVVDESAKLLPHVFYGENEEFVHTNKDDLAVVPIIQQTNTINLTVTGLPSDNENYLFAISDDNGAYSFKNEFVAFTDFSYTQNGTFAQELKASIVTMKLADNRSPLLTIGNSTTGKTIFPAYEGQLNNIVEMIKRSKLPAINNFEQTHVYNIEINFATDMSVTITVNDWNVIDDSGNELIPD
jgi:hypothetical protein